MGNKNNSKPNNIGLGSITTNIQEFNNTSLGLIHITEEKLENILLKNEKTLTAKKMWVTPLSIFISCGLSLVTNEFKNFLSFSSDTWTAVFIIATFISFIWFICSSIKSFKMRNKGGIDDIMECIKNSKYNQVRASQAVAASATADEKCEE